MVVKLLEILRRPSTTLKSVRVLSLQVCKAATKTFQEIKAIKTSKYNFKWLKVLLIGFIKTALCLFLPLIDFFKDQGCTFQRSLSEYFSLKSCGKEC